MDLGTFEKEMGQVIKELKEPSMYERVNDIAEQITVVAMGNRNDYDQREGVLSMDELTTAAEQVWIDNLPAHIPIEAVHELAQYRAEFSRGVGKAMALTAYDELTDTKLNFAENKIDTADVSFNVVARRVTYGDTANKSLVVCNVELDHSARIDSRLSSKAMVRIWGDV